MTFFKTLTPQNRQKLLAALVGFIIILILFLIFWMIDREGFSDMKPADPVYKTSLTTAQDRMNPQAIWVERVENETKLTQKKIEALEKTLKAFMKNQAPTQEERLSSQADAPSELETSSSSEVETGEVLPALDFERTDPRAPSEGTPPQEPSYNAPRIRKVVLNLSKSGLLDQKGQTPDAVENTIPANAYATAVILGGVDASTAIHASSNPRPVLLRILDKGNLPRKFKSDLKNCRVSASAYGDISSERVYMRLEKLTCIEPLTGETIQTQVAGYVLGEDGRAGVRGIVVDRAGEVMRQSLMGGFLSGMSQFFGAQQQRSVFPVSPFGQTNSLPTDKMLGTSLAQGAGNALEKYADFFIKRAEQLQPVLQVAAGRKVDIVFTEGTRFGETSVRKAIERVRNQARTQTVNQFEQRSLTEGLNPGITPGAESQNWLPPVQESE